MSLLVTEIEQEYRQKILDTLFELALPKFSDNFPGVTVELEQFPSGVMMLDVRYHDKLFVIDYAPSHGFFCVGEVTEEDGFNTGFNFTTRDIDSAIMELKRLMSL